MEAHDAKMDGRTAGRRLLYNRLFLINTAVFLLLLTAFAAVASRLSVQMELERLQQKNQDALSAVCSFYESKHDGYVNLVYPFYEVPENYRILTDLLETGDANAFENDPFLRQEITRRLSDLCARDDDIEAIYLYSNAARSTYVFYRRFNTFSRGQVPQAYAPLLSGAIIGRIPLGAVSLGVTVQSVRPTVYAIASSVGTQHVRTQAGKLVIAYNAASLSRIWQRYAATARGRCLLVSDAGDVIFDSTGASHDAAWDSRELLARNGETVDVAGEKTLVLVQANPARKYSGVMLVPVRTYAGDIGGTARLVWFSCAAFALLSVLLHLMAGLRVSRRVGTLRTAMARVGSHNLADRIRLQGPEDEFTDVARHFNRMCDDLQENIDRLYLLQLRQKSAELGALQARINPHFLYNSLEAVRARVLEDGNDDASDMIAELAMMFRDITKGRVAGTLREELQFLHAYIHLFACRHGNRLETSIDVAPDLLEAGMIRYLLQPVVENYFVHGYKADQENSRLSITSKRETETILLRIHDNGRGISPDRLQVIRDSLASGIDERDGSYGLRNVHERLRLVYGADCGLEIDAREGEWTSVMIRFRAMEPEALERLMHTPGA